MATMTLVSASDEEILADLQRVKGVKVNVVGYKTTPEGPAVTWDNDPSEEDCNRVASYFQQNSQLRNWQ